MYLVLYVFFAFLVPVSIESQSQLLSSINTPSKPLRYRNLTKSISLTLTTSTTYNNTHRSNQLHQSSSRQLSYYDCTFLFAIIWNLGTVWQVYLFNKNQPNNNIMKIYHMTKSTLKSRLNELKSYQSTCEDDFESCEIYQLEIDEVESALYCGKCGSYVMDNRDFTEEL